MDKSNKLSNKLLSQLHEQYAINNNAKDKNFITFLIAVFSLLGAYGYIYIQTYKGLDDSIFKDSLVVSTCCGEMFHPKVLILITCLISLLMFFLSFMVIILGSSIRRDHIINYRIRQYAFNTELYKQLWSKNLYNPLNKNMFNFLPDYYNLFFMTFQVINFIITFSTCNLLQDSSNNCCIYWWVAIGVFVFSILVLSEYYCKYYDYISQDVVKRDEIVTNTHY